MVDHNVVQVRLQLSLDPENPLKCCGYQIQWRRPLESEWHLIADEAFAPEEDSSWFADVGDDLFVRVLGLPRTIPFP